MKGKPHMNKNRFVNQIEPTKSADAKTLKDVVALAELNRRSASTILDMAQNIHSLLIGHVTSTDEPSATEQPAGLIPRLLSVQNETDMVLADADAVLKKILKILGNNDA